MPCKQTLITAWLHFLIGRKQIISSNQIEMRSIMITENSRTQVLN